MTLPFMPLPLPVGVPQPLPESPLWMLYRLSTRLEADKPRLLELGDYYRGIQRLPVVTDESTREDLLHLLTISGSNYMRPVVNAEKQRIKWQGVRLQDNADAEPDEQTWEMIQANNLEADSPVLWQTALAQRRAYLSVWYPQKGDDQRYPVIRIEDPTQCYVEHDPTDRRRRRGAIKVWVDDWTGYQFANLYTPDRIYKWRWEPVTRAKPYSGWVVREVDVPNPLGVVPIVPIVNQPGLHWQGWSEIDDLIQIQDRINTTIFNRSVAEHFAAFRQKWATGLEVPVDENGDPVDSFVSAINKFWLNEDPNGKFGQFEATDLKNYGAAKESDVQDIAVISSTPRHYFTVNGQAPSGDSMKSAEAGLVAKVIDFERTASGALRETVRLARKVKGLDTPVDCEILWADPEYQTLGQLVDSHVKLYAAGILPRRDVLEKLGYTPPQIARIEAAMLQADLMAQALETTATEVPGSAAQVPAGG